MNIQKSLFAIICLSVYLIHPTDKSTYFKELLNKTENSLKKELDKNITPNPSIDIFLITARNESEKSFYEDILKAQYSYLFRDDIKVIVIADPDEKGGFIGSTGSLLYALSKLKTDYLKNKNFNELRISIIKAGGMARRMIAASTYANKCQMPIPIKKDLPVLTNTLYFAILNSYFFGQKMQSEGFSGLIVLCSDQLFLSDAEIKEGTNYFVDPVSLNDAKRSELIIEASDSRKILDFKRKPSKSLREKISNNEINKGNKIWSELTNNYIIAGKSRSFFDMYAKYIEATTKIKDLIDQSDRGYEIFTSDCILPFFMHEDDYISLRLREYQTPHKTCVDSIEKRTKFYANLYQIIKKYANPDIYLCGNENDTFCEEIVDTIRFYKNGLMNSSEVSKIYQLESIYNSIISDNTIIGDSCFIYRSKLTKNSRIDSNSVILGSTLEASTIGQDSIVINIKGKINIPDHSVLAKTPIIIDGKKAYALIFVGIDDNPKYEDNSATIFGQLLKIWLKTKKIDFKSDNISLFTVPIFPIVFDDEFDMELISWMTQNDKLPSNIYLNSKHVSLQDIICLIDHSSITKNN